jgi:hypothetical protein
MSIAESKEHRIDVSRVGIPKEVMKDCSDPRDIIREFISNSGAKEVKADTLKVYKYSDPEYGLSFRIFDDGIGMDYTGNINHQGRLDRFLNLGYSKVSGLKSDEFSHKGLGTALMYNSRRVEVETCNGDELIEVVIDDPRGHFWKENPEPPIPRVTKHRTNSNSEIYTEITILGFDGGGGAHFKAYGFNRIKEYLKWRTLVGCTVIDRIKSLPKIILNVDSKSEEIEVGYPWITDDGTDDTVIFDPVNSVKESEGTKVSVTVKGGMTLNTKEHGLKQKYAGLTVSVNGIPYFRKRNFINDRFNDVHWKFMNLVVECNDLNLNISRNGYYEGDLIGKLFKNAVYEALREIENSESYQQFASHVRKKKRRRQADDLHSRKEKLQSPSHKYIMYDDRILHSLPKSENDTLAILWKLEALQLLPFYLFRTLEHTPQKGMDLIVDFQETEESERKSYVTVEVERNFSSFERHDHSPAHTDYVICWMMNADTTQGDIERVDNYKYIYKSGVDYLTVFSLEDIIRYNDELQIRSKSEI